MRQRPRPIPTSENKLFGELVDRYKGPILVIGGGPSADIDLPELKRRGFKPLTVISANEHGYKQDIYRPEFAVVCDYKHGETRAMMEIVLRNHGARIITAMHFGDFRLADWKMNTNAGLTAVAVACLMGGAPVVVTGIDFYKLFDEHAPTYFHDADAVSNSNKKNRKNFEQQLAHLRARVEERWANIRAVSGGARFFWPGYKPGDGYLPHPLPRAGMHQLKALEGQKLVQCRPRPPVPWLLGTIEPLRIIRVSDIEAAELVSSKFCREVDEEMLTA